MHHGRGIEDIQDNRIISGNHSTYEQRKQADEDDKQYGIEDIYSG